MEFVQLQFGAIEIATSVDAPIVSFHRAFVADDMVAFLALSWSDSKAVANDADCIILLFLCPLKELKQVFLVLFDFTLFILWKWMPHFSSSLDESLENLSKSE